MNGYLADTARKPDVPGGMSSPNAEGMRAVSQVPVKLAAVFLLSSSSLNNYTASSFRT